MIEARDLTRRYGGHTAVDGVSFAVGEGEIVGFLGPNGAGKTSTLRMITGYLAPSAGTVTVAGRSLRHAPRAARREIGYLPEAVALYPEMRVEEYLAYRAKLHGLRGSERRGAVREALERCLLTAVRRQLVGTLSKGFRQRVGLAQAILHRPRVLVLDEPTAGLDPQQIVAIRELIRELGRERSLILSSHILPEVELLCDRVLILHRGRIVGEGSPETLRRGWSGLRTLQLTLKGDPPGALEALASLPGVRRVEEGAVEAGFQEEGAGETGGHRRFRVTAEPGADLREPLFRAAVAHGWVLLELAPERASLEDIFLGLTAEDTATDSADGATEESMAEPGESTTGPVPSEGNP